MKERIGFVGVGLMGHGMARNLVEKGWPVTVLACAKVTATALLFSIYMVKPSPFCVLDELDAPLDEFSLAAFTTLMAELKTRSQFIVITHNQRTMQRADQIHGVTMDRPGVSRIISLRIPQAA